MRDAISRYRFPKKLLKVGSVILIKELSPDDHPGIVIQDHDKIDPPGAASLFQIRKIAGIRLPHPAKICLKCFPVFYRSGHIPAQVVLFDITLHA